MIPTRAKVVIPSRWEKIRLAPLILPMHQAPEELVTSIYRNSETLSALRIDIQLFHEVSPFQALKILGVYAESTLTLAH